MARNTSGLTHSASHPQLEPFGRLKVLSSIEGLGPKPTSAFKGRVPLRVNPRMPAGRLSNRKGYRASGQSQRSQRKGVRNF